MDIARALVPRHLRLQYMERVSQILAGQELGDGSVARAARQAANQIRRNRPLAESLLRSTALRESPVRFLAGLARELRAATIPEARPEPRHRQGHEEPSAMAAPSISLIGG